MEHATVLEARKRLFGRVLNDGCMNSCISAALADRSTAENLQGSALGELLNLVSQSQPLRHGWLIEIPIVYDYIYVLRDRPSSGL